MLRTSTRKGDENVYEDVVAQLRENKTDVTTKGGRFEVPNSRLGSWNNRRTCEENVIMQSFIIIKVRQQRNLSFRSFGRA